jgi:hypothetical protein
VRAPGVRRTLPAPVREGSEGPRLLRTRRNDWHGPAPNRFMTHIAIQEANDHGSPVNWGKHVTDEEYNIDPAT